MQIVISLRPQPLAADSFLHALESPLSTPFKGMLGDMLLRHKAHVMVSVIPTDSTGEASKTKEILALRVAHAASTLVAEWHQPGAVHWRQSNQLITGAQYQGLADDATPWALFAQARGFSATHAPEGKRRVGVRLDEATALIGRPIVFRESDLPFDRSYACALSFLRHAVETGSPIPDSHTFGPEGGDVILVSHKEPTEELPDGFFELIAIEIKPEKEPELLEMATNTLETNMTDRSRTESDGYDPVIVDHRKERTRSLVISYVMLATIPPVGLFLLISNLFFGANAARTGLIASTSVAAALLVGVFTFLNIEGQAVASLDKTLPITTLTLPD